LNGLKLARGDYIAYIQEGDILYPNHIALLIEWVQKEEQKIVCSEFYILEDENLNQPLACFIHENACIKDSLLENDDLLITSNDKAFYLPMLRFLNEKYNVVKLDKITGETKLQS
jgi:hypothetical protein